jgi:CubicO group peptidase (beta-lactamase class C family)
MKALIALEELLVEAALEGVFAGSMALLGVGDELIWEAAAGYQSLAPARRPAGLGTIYDVASVTKVAATASAAALLVGQGALGLDDPVGKHLHGWPQPKAPITVRHLLNHTSGFAGWKAYGRMWLEEHELAGHLARPSEESRAWMLDTIVGDDLAYAPGASCIYSDPGFIVLWEVLERAAGEPLRAYLARELFTPLGMVSTFFMDLTGARAPATGAEGIAPTEDCPVRGRVLCGEVHDLNAWALGGVSGHAGLFSTASDLHRLGTAWLSALRGMGEGPFDAESAAEFFRLQRPDLASTFALGWDSPKTEGSLTGVMLGRSARGQWGYTGCSLWLEPVRNLVIVLLSNRVHPHDTPPDAMAVFRPRFHDNAVAAAEEALR